MQPKKILEKIAEYDLLFNYKEISQEEALPRIVKSFKPHHLSTQNLAMTLRYFQTVSQDIDLLLDDKHMDFLKALKSEVLDFEAWLTNGNLAHNIMSKKQTLDWMSNLETFYKRFGFDDKIPALQGRIANLDSDTEHIAKDLEDKLGNVSVSTKAVLRDIEELASVYSKDNSLDVVKKGLGKAIKNYSKVNFGKYPQLAKPRRLVHELLTEMHEGIDKFPDQVLENLSVLYTDINKISSSLYLDSQFRLKSKKINMYNIAKEVLKPDKAGFSALSTVNLYVNKDFGAVFDMIAKTLDKNQQAIFSIREGETSYTVYSYVSGGYLKNPGTASSFSIMVLRNVLSHYNGKLAISSIKNKGEPFINYQIHIPKDSFSTSSLSNVLKNN